MEEFKDLIELQDKLSDMADKDLFEYVQNTYPDNPELWYGKKKLIIRRVLNFERNLRNSP